MGGKYTVFVSGVELDLWLSVDLKNSLDLTVNQATIQFPDSSSLTASEGVGSDIQIKRDGVPIWNGLGVKYQKIYDSQGKKQYNLVCSSNKIYLKNVIFQLGGLGGPTSFTLGGAQASTTLPGTPTSTLATSLFNNILGLTPSLFNGTVGSTNVPHACLTVARQTCLAVLGQLIAGTLWEARFNADNTLDFGSNSNGTVGSLTSVYTFQEGLNMQKTEVDYGIDKLVNYVIVCGAGSVGSQITATASNSSSIAQFGTFSKIITLSNCSDPNLLQAYANALVTDLSNQVYTVNCELVDFSTGVTFKMGDYVTVNNPSFGLNNAQFRIISEQRHYDAQVGEDVNVILAQNYRMVDVAHYKRLQLEAVLNTQMQNQQVFNNSFQSTPSTPPNPIVAPNVTSAAAPNTAQADTYASLGISGVNNGTTTVSLTAGAQNSGISQSFSSLGYIIPAYINPDNSSGQTAWGTLASDVAAHGTVEAIVIMNPYNGPSTYDANYYRAGSPPTGILPPVKNAGGTIIGYVATEWGGRSQANIESDVDTYFSYYGNVQSGGMMGGIFFDQMGSKNGGTASFYNTISSYVKTKYGSTMKVVGNPGGTFTGESSSWFVNMDIVMGYENGALPSVSTVASQTSGTYGGAASSWGIFAYSVSSTTFNNNFVSDIAPFSQYIGWIFVSDQGSAYNSLPSYESTELTDLAGSIGGSQGSVLSGGYFRYLFDYPNDNSEWTNLISYKQNNPSVAVYAAVNISNGIPTSPADSQYQTYIGKLQAAGIAVLGTIYTDYGALNGQSTSTYEGYIDSYYNLYGVDGILAEQMDTTNNSTNWTWYQTLQTYVHGKTPTVSGLTQCPFFGDPGGVCTTTGYIGKLDVILQNFSGLPSASTVHSDTTTLGGTASDWAIAVYNQSTAPSATFLGNVSGYIAWIACTDQTSLGSSTAPTYESTTIAHLVSTLANPYISRIKILNASNGNAVLYDSGAGNYGTSKTVNQTVAGDIADQVIDFQVVATGNGTQEVLATISNAQISLGVNIPT